MPKSESSTTPAKKQVSSTANRMDGLRRVAVQSDAPTKTPKKVPVGERPLPKAVEFTSHHQVIMHPNGADQTMDELLHPHHRSHPSLPVQKSRPTAASVRRSIFRTVVIESFREHHDRRATNSLIIATLISPLFWLLTASPWLITGYVSTISPTLERTYQRLHAFIGSPFDRVILITVGLLALFSIIWVTRHILMSLSYAIHLRTIDNRLANTRQIAWQTIAKLPRLVWLAVGDFVLFSLILALASWGLWSVITPIASNLFYQGLYVNLIVVATIISLSLLAVHRPLSRVMLAATNQSLWFINRRSFGMTMRNFMRSLALGLTWLLVAAISASLISGIIWATISYGLVSVGPRVPARIGLAIVSSGLIYLVCTVFMIWSHGYWTRAYHILAHRTYPQSVSGLFSSDQHPASQRKSIILAICGFLLVLGIFIGVTYIARNQLKSVHTSINNWLPETLEELIQKR